MGKRSQKRIVSVRRAKNTLRRFLVPFFRKARPRPKEIAPMLLPNVSKLAAALRERGKQIRANNKKIDEWVDRYINRCALAGEPVTILTQWCLAKDLEIRFNRQGGFSPTQAEEQLFEREIPGIISLFRSNGIAVRWMITFNRSYLDLGRISPDVESDYCQMIIGLASRLGSLGLECLNWEDDILGGRPEPDAEVLANIGAFVPESAFRLDLERHRPWVIASGIKETEEELRRDVAFKIACEVREGQMITDPEWYFGECLIVPLETTERYDFFGLKAPRIKSQVAAIVPPYPWRV